MSLLSAGSISLDSTFKSYFLQETDIRLYKFNIPVLLFTNITSGACCKDIVCSVSLHIVRTAGHYSAHPPPKKNRNSKTPESTLFITQWLWILTASCIFLHTVCFRVSAQNHLVSRQRDPLLETFSKVNFTTLLTSVFFVMKDSFSWDCTFPKEPWRKRQGRE